MSRRSRGAPSKRDRRRPSNGHAIIGGKLAIAAPAVAEGQARCPVCANAVRMNKTGRLRKHRDLFGGDCPNTGPGATIHLEVVPDVVVPPERPPSRLDAGSNCQECGKWLPGERRLCGRCFATGGRR